MQDKLLSFLDHLRNSLNDDSFVKLSLGDYRGSDPALKKLIAKKVLIKKKVNLSFVYRYKTKDITKNYMIPEGIELIKSQIGKDHFRFAHLGTLEQDFKLQIFKNGKKLLKKDAPSFSVKPGLQHDKQKTRHIKAVGNLYLHELNITDSQGRVYKNAQDKYKQINHYIEILSSLLKDLPKKDVLEVVDMGSGKGYLTFALYDYLNNSLQRPSVVRGIEFRKDLVEFCNQVASSAKFGNLHFEAGSIQGYSAAKDIDMLVALHACDTATDEAIFKGIRSNAELIVVAPCCHKQIRKEMEKHKRTNALHFVTQHGIFLERQAEMVTDSLRALILNYHGYTTKVFEFISDAHTPKNILIVGRKVSKYKMNKLEIGERIQSSKKFFGIKRHHLEALLEMKA